MKKLIHILNGGLVIMLMSLCSCEPWINVTPTDRLSEEMLFKDREGFVKALNGVYIELNTNELYGLNLTAGALDAMGQYYTNFSSSTHAYYQYIKLIFTEANEKALFDNVWKKCYLVIANCNTIIEKCGEGNANLPEPYFSMIKGEALALRAMLHFDMLRLFGPIPSELSKESIPYQTTSKQQVSSLLPGTEVLGLVIKDLKEALDLLKVSDPYLAENQSVYDETDVKLRQFRMNYCATAALLARVYLWGGDRTSAYAVAKEILQAVRGDATLFPFVTNAAATNTSTPDRVFSTEVLFGCYNSSRNTIQETLFAPTLETARLLTFAGTLNSGRVDELYDDKNDYRYRIWATYNNNGTSILYHRKYEDFEDNSGMRTYRYIVPLIRLSEVYLIAAECCDDLEEAVGYLNTLRNARNCFSVNPTVDGLNNYIASEYRKEMLGEGQMFFFYKRKEMVNIPDGTLATGTMNVELNQYVVPLPDSETSQRTSTDTSK
ncbi:MAG: RagB/SusD family nutrient uptake outer membrane protein [Odoribacter sp.]|nr:RagB/SusD family nutrient uptake outer membrane protein [Odoribacter sp.]